ncbi:Small ubiquitin-related modifier 5 [Linum grandiflorum]
MSSSNHPFHHRVQADEEAPAASDRMRLRIQSQDGDKLHFKANCNAPIRSVLDLYCREKFVDLTVLRFVIDGKDFDYRKTPVQLGLKDNDLIVVLMYNGGG